MGLFYKYVFSSMALNGLYKSFDLYDAKILRSNNEKTNLLITEKLTIVTIHSLFGPYIFPYRVFDILNKIELKLRGENSYKYDLNKYEKHQTFYNHIFDF
jgi:hypothetical protein